MEVIMAKYGEIALKGLNRSSFEDLLVRNVRRRLKPLGEFDITRRQSTIFIQPLSEDIDMDMAVKKVCSVFGIAAVQRSAVLPKDMDEIIRQGIPYLADALERAKSFKVEAKRSDKKFPLTSPQIQQALGIAIGEAYPDLEADMHSPELTVMVEIRDKAAYVNAEKLPAAGGMPVGSNGNALLLLSGGIDSPVAAFMMAKRGLRVDAVHFQSPPYTSERALMKVETLCEKLTEYCGDIRFYCVPFTEIQEALRDNCSGDYFTVIMRRLMLKIANRLCERGSYGALITGESVGQVASQTLAAISCTDKAAEYPVLRPLVGMDKKEIIEIARRIDTFETSILPYEDCCTVFTPKHPKTKPLLKDVLAEEEKFDFSPLIEKAIGGITVKDFKLG
ncbi:MAG: tRNA 4-thiouridine(8) synthase ThiI [Oscillospiraceae bacterium]|nr:tRNA 4-thiouridine(8) synthase ThiI [Oscillospiraceae bacterium]